MLIQEFQSKPEWSKDNMQEVSRKTGLSEAQVYKWGWDQKRKLLDPTRDITDELRLYKEHELELESEDASVVQKLKFQSSQKKQNKNQPEKRGNTDKHAESSMKTRKSAAKESKYDNKENEYNKNMSSKTETRGVRRKLKAFGDSKNHY
jgi:transposase-like protein